MKHHDVSPVAVGKIHLPDGALKARLREDEKRAREEARWNPGPERRARRGRKTELVQVKEGSVTLTEDQIKYNKVHVLHEHSRGCVRFTLTEQAAYDLADALDEYIDEMEQRYGWGENK